MDLLQIKNLVKTYGKDNTMINALNGVTFTIKKGEFVTVVNRSGSGKSTLMHIMGGIDRPTSGNVVGLLTKLLVDLWMLWLPLFIAMLGMQ